MSLRNKFLLPQNVTILTKLAPCFSMWLLGMNLHIPTFLNVPENASEKNIVKALPTGKFLVVVPKLMHLKNRYSRETSLTYSYLISPMKMRSL